MKRPAFLYTYTMHRPLSPHPTTVHRVKEKQERKMAVSILYRTVIALLSMVLGFMLFSAADQVLGKLTRPL